MMPSTRSITLPDDVDEKLETLMAVFGDTSNDVMAAALRAYAPGGWSPAPAPRNTNASEDA